jgi:membrane dipeptidase
MQQQTRRALLSAAASALVAPPAWAQANTRRNSGYERAIVIDALGGPGGSDGANQDPFAPLNAQDIADIRASGLTALNLTISSVGNDPSAFEQTIAAVAWCEREIGAHPDVLMQIRSAADLQTAKRTKRLGLIYGLQDTYLLGPSLDRVDMFAGLGLRISQLTYNRRNLAGDGCLEPQNGGLSGFGRALVEAFNHHKILVDGAHGGEQTILDGVAASSAPTAITHTGCRALVDVPRNVNDNVLRAVADKGGVIGIYFMPFLRAHGQASAADLIAHIEHALNVAGEDHVGLGTDGSISPQATDAAALERQHHFVDERVRLGIAAPGEDRDVFNIVTEYNQPRKFERLANDLEARGHAPRRVEKILGANFARLFAEVWGSGGG